MKSAQKNTQEYDLERMNIANQGLKQRSTFVANLRTKPYVSLLRCPGQKELDLLRSEGQYVHTYTHL